MSIVDAIVRWLVVAALLFAGADLLLVGVGFDVANAIHGFLGADAIVSALAFLQSLANHFVRSAYIPPVGAALMALALLVIFIRA